MIVSATVEKMVVGAFDVLCVAVALELGVTAHLVDDFTKFFGLSSESWQAIFSQNFATIPNA